MVPLQTTPDKANLSLKLHLVSLLYSWRAIVWNKNKPWLIYKLLMSYLISKLHSRLLTRPNTILDIVSITFIHFIDDNMCTFIKLKQYIYLFKQVFLFKINFWPKFLLFFHFKTSYHWQETTKPSPNVYESSKYILYILFFIFQLDSYCLHQLFVKCPSTFLHLSLIIGLIIQYVNKSLNLVN